MVNSSRWKCTLWGPSSCWFCMTSVTLILISRRHPFRCTGSWTSQFFSYGLSYCCIHCKNMAAQQETQAAGGCLLLIVQRDLVTKLEIKLVLDRAKKIRLGYEKWNLIVKKNWTVKKKLNCWKKNNCEKKNWTVKKKKLNCEKKIELWKKKVNCEPAGPSYQCANQNCVTYVRTSENHYMLLWFANGYDC